MISDKTTILLRFLIPYMLMMLIPLSIGFFVYHKTVDVLEDEVVEKNMALLQQSKKVLDAQLEEVELFAQNMTTHPKVVSFQYERDVFHRDQVYKTLEIRKAVSSVVQQSRFIDDFLLLFKNSELALTADSTYKWAELYPGFLRYGQYDYTSWRQLMLADEGSRYLPAERVHLEGKAMNRVTYLAPIGAPIAFNGMLAVMMDNRHFTELLQGMELSQDGWAYIADRNGTVISYLSASGQPPMPLQLQGREGVLAPEDGDDSGLIVTYTTSDYNDWVYVAAQPSDLLFSKVHYIRNISLIILAAMGLIGLLLASVLAYRNSRPIRKIALSIMELQGKATQPMKDIHHFIQQAVTRLALDNRKLQNKVEAQMPLLRAAMFERLLKGDFANRDELQMIMQHAEMNPPESNYYLIAVIDIRGDWNSLSLELLQQLDVRRIVLKEWLEDISDYSCLIHDLSEGKLAVMLSSSESDERAAVGIIERKLREKETAYYDQFHTQFAVALGSCSRDLMQMSRSYEEALLALHYMRPNDMHYIVRHDEVPRSSSSFYYPAELETRLSNLIRAGETAGVEKLLEELYEENFRQRHLSLQMSKLLLFEVCGSLMKVLDYVSLKSSDLAEQAQQLVDHIGHSSESEPLFRQLSQWMAEISLQMAKRKRSRNEQLKQEMLERVKRSYGDAGLSLLSMADELQMSETYLSQFFKEQTGVTFSEYVNNLRMEQARMLLRETDLPIHEVTERIGYQSSNTFCRAFKRINGVTPTKYRQEERTQQPSGHARA
ncbi:helix-turn-helix domain-containing protein [Paenibacillus chungangensis]|uniref:Helix-turn-helix domain-containing protein n=1 Tax=Paenibacillus chungangensis TaxID=696535 RepID=A0ABW3HJY4_9BACL